MKIKEIFETAKNIVKYKKNDGKYKIESLLKMFNIKKLKRRRISALLLDFVPFCFNGFTS